VTIDKLLIEGEDMFNKIKLTKNLDANVLDVSIIDDYEDNPVLKN
jgi:hypothetical protein